jgi:hypothetical protein
VAAVNAAYLLDRYRTEFVQGDLPAAVRAVAFSILRAVGGFLGRDRRYAGAPPPITR